MITLPKPRTGIALSAILLLALILGSGHTFAHDSEDDAVEPQRPAPFGDALLLGHLQNRIITEASGMAASRLHSDVLWILNDGGDAPALYAVDLQGAHLGRMRIRNARNVDWEDLAAFRIDRAATLLIADVGDNRAQRADAVLYFVREPDITGHSVPFDISVDWYRRMRFEYADGPRDCEGVAVDADRNKILLVTKRTVPPVIYELPLQLDGEQPLMVARRIAVVQHLQPPAAAPPVEDFRFEKLRSQPTAMDISPDGSEIAILTYGDGYLYRRPAHLDWSKVFRNPPQWIRMPKLRQAEALCFSADGQSLIVTSEQLPAPLYRLDRRSASHQGSIP